MKWIYALASPQGDVRYVGAAEDPESRLTWHRWKAKYSERPSPMHAWLKGLLSSGKEPLLWALLEVPPKAEWEQFERWFIWDYQRLGCSLLNKRSGGEGVSSEQAKAQWANPKIRKAREASIKAAWATPKVKRNHRKAMADPKTSAKLTAAQTERWSKEGARERQSAVMSQSNGTPEAREYFRLTSIASRTPKVRKAISKSSKSRWSDPAYRARVVAAQKAAVQAAWNDPVKRAARLAKFAARRTV